MVKLIMSWTSVFVVTVLACLWTGSGLEARIIGIVHDDSGSMKDGGHVHLPAFGPQFIISTLDGQTNPTTADRLFYALLNDGRVTFAPITSAGQQQAEIDRMRKRFPQPGGGTPLRMVQRTLEEIVAKGRQDEEIFLVIVTDGGFNASDDASFQRSIRDFQAAVARASQQAKGPVRTEFVLINPKNDNGFVSAVRAQGVFPLLNSTFNGDPEDGFHNVTSFDQMFAALKKITARISGTEDLGKGSKIKLSGDRMTLDSPFSISRIVAVSTSDNGQAPPSVVSTSFGQEPTYSYSTEMEKPDTATGWNRTVSGISQHFVFQPALKPGNHSINFNQTLGKNSFLLFESNAVIELQIYDENGVKLVPDANGIIEVSQGSEYDLRAEVFSEASAGSPVNFSELETSATFKTDLTAPAGNKTSLPMARNDPENRAEGKVTFAALGDHGLQAVLRWPGFVSPTSKITRVKVVDRQASLVLTLDPVESGPQGGITVDVAAPGTPAPLAAGDLTVTDQAGVATGATLSLEGAPAWITLEGPSGQKIGESDVVPLETRIAIISDGSQITSGADTNPAPFRIRATAATPARGSAQIEVPMTVRLAEAKVRPTGHSKDPSGATPLDMNGTELTQNKKNNSGGIDALDFEIRDTLVPPEIGENVEIVGNPPFGLRLRPELTGNTVSVFPETAWWCPCILYFTAHPTKISVLYDDGRGLQRASSEAQILDVKITGREAIISCLLILGLILLILYLLKALVNGLNTQRFPKRAIAEIDDGGELTRKPALRGTNLTFLKVLLWPIFGVPHERASIDGLALQARRGGAILLLNESSLNFESDTYDDLKEFREENPKKDTLQVAWLEEFKSTSGSEKTIRLLRDIAESR